MIKGANQLKQGRPKVTVVIAAYNVSDYILHAIDSVRRQTLRDVEILVSDDCSTDDTADLVRTVALEDDRIRLVHTPQNSGGVGAPRNLGVVEAKGEYILFLDADDFLGRHACKNLYDLAQENDADLVCGKIVRRRVRTGALTAWYGGLYTERKKLKSIREFPELTNDTAATNKLYKVDWLRENKCFFEEKVHYEEMEFTARVFTLADAIGVLPEIIYYWNVYPNEERKSISNQRDSLQNVTDRMAALRKVSKIFDGYNDSGLSAEFNLKLLRHHFRVHLNDVLLVEEGFAREVIHVIAQVVKGIPLAAFDVLEPVERALYGYVLEESYEGVFEAILHEIKHVSAGQVLLSNDDLVWIPSSWNLQEVDSIGSAVAKELIKVTGWSKLDSFSGLKFRNTVKEVATTSKTVSVRGTTDNFLGDFNPEASVLVLASSTSDQVLKFPIEETGRKVGVVEWRAHLPKSMNLELDRGQNWRVRLEQERFGVKNSSPILIDDKLVISSHILGQGTLQKIMVGGLEFYRTRFGNLALRVKRTGYSASVPSRALAKIHRSLSLSRPGINPSKSQRTRLVYSMIRRLPLQSDLLFAEHNLGMQPADSVKAVVEAARVLDPNLKIVWSTRTKTVEIPAGDSRVIRESWLYYYYAARAAFIVDNQSLPRTVQTRPGQKYLQTWHGIPLKVMGSDEKRFKLGSQTEIEAVQRQTNRWTALVSPCQYFVDTFVNAFSYQGKLLSPGSPRNDVLITADSVQIDELRRKHDIPAGKRVILYAPTFRDTHKRNGSVAPLTFDLTEYLEQASPDDFLILRPHYLNKYRIPRKYLGQVRDMGSVNEISELYLISDVLITDYSSVMFDYAITGKPIVLFCPDYDEYVESRGGLYFDLRTDNPGVFVESQEDLQRVLANRQLLSAAGGGQYAQFVERYCGQEDGFASVRAAKYLLEEQS